MRPGIFSDISDLTLKKTLPLIPTSRTDGVSDPLHNVLHKDFIIIKQTNNTRFDILFKTVCYRYSADTAAPQEQPRKKDSLMKINAIILLSLSTFGFASSAFAAGDAAKGQALYAQRCAMCHGDKGAGDGALAATMPADQKPRNLSGADYKYAKDDAKLKEIISKGGAAVGLSVLMPAQSDLNDAQLDDVVAFVKSLRK